MRTKLPAIFTDCRSWSRRLTLLGALALLPGIQQCNQQTCTELDEQGNPILVECIKCGNRDDNPCTEDGWNIPPGGTCALYQQPAVPDGTPCDDQGVPDVCIAGVCGGGLVLAAGSGSSTWRATAGVSGPPDGCILDILNTFVPFDVEITMHASSDGYGYVTVGYSMTIQSFSFPLQHISESASLEGGSFDTSISNAELTTARNGIEPFAASQNLGELGLQGDTFVVSTATGLLTEETFRVAPTSTQPVNVNFSGQFMLDLFVDSFGINPFESAKCDFDVQGAGVEFIVDGCTVDADCNDGNACTTSACNLSLARCQPTAPTNDGGACDPGTGQTGQCLSGTCYLPQDCRIGTTPQNEGSTCTLDGGSGVGNCQAGLCVLADTCSRDRDCELDGNECTEPICDMSSVPFVCAESAAAADGTWCNGFQGVCNSGACEPSARLAPLLSGSGQWKATTSPPGGGTGATGGCMLSATGGGTYALDTTVSFNASTDVNGLLAVDYVFAFESPLLPGLAVTPDRVVTVTLTSANGFDWRGVSVVDYPPTTWSLANSTLLLDVPGKPDSVWTSSTSTSAANVNWSGELDVDLDGFDTLTEADCVFDVQDPGLDFPVLVGAPPPAGCAGGDCGPPWEQQAYIKASNSDVGDELGTALALDGDTLIVGAPNEDSIAVGVNASNQANDAAPSAGAAYIYERVGSVWSQVAYVKASNGAEADNFGKVLAIDGDTILVGSTRKGTDETGAVYVFERSGGVWVEAAILTPSDGDPNDYFGSALAIEGDRFVVGAPFEDSAATGVNGAQNNDGALDSGAAYVFEKVAGSWTQTAYLKAGNTDPGDGFGSSVALVGDLIVVGARGEESFTGDPQDNGGPNVGAAYVYEQIAGNWTLAAYLKPSNPQGQMYFGDSVAAADDTIAVGARSQAGTGQGVGASQGTLGATGSGAVYVFERVAGQFTQTTYIKASNAEAFDYFGTSVALLGDTLLVGAPGEASAAVGAQGDQNDNSSNSSGAAYVFDRVGGAWSQVGYLKPSNTLPNGFGGLPEGYGSAVDMSGNTLVMGAPNESSSSREVDGHPYLLHGGGFGAAYVIERTP